MSSDDLQSLNRLFDEVNAMLRVAVVDISVKFKEIRRAGVHQTDFKEIEDLYIEVGNVIADLAMFFQSYPDMTDRIRGEISRSSERTVIQTWEAAEKSIINRYYSFQSLKDLVMTLERQLRLVIGNIKGWIG